MAKFYVGTSFKNARSFKSFDDLDSAVAYANKVFEEKPLKVFSGKGKVICQIEKDAPNSVENIPISVVGDTLVITSESESDSENDPGYNNLVVNPNSEVGSEIVNCSLITTATGNVLKTDLELNKGPSFVYKVVTFGVKSFGDLPLGAGFTHDQNIFVKVGKTTALVYGVDPIEKVRMAKKTKVNMCSLEMIFMM